jgi:hypothetical protein
VRTEVYNTHVCLIELISMLSAQACITDLEVLHCVYIESGGCNKCQNSLTGV